MLKIISLLLLISANAQAEPLSGATAEAAAGITVAQSSAPALNDARRLIQHGQDDEAIGVLGQLLQASPDNFQAWFLLGVTQAKQRRFHDAIASFGKVVALQPKLAEPHNNLAVIYNELGDFRAAVKELEASLQLKPDYATAHENIGDLYVKLAADAYRKALQEDSRPALRQRYERLLHIHQADDHPSAAETHPGSTVSPGSALQSQKTAIVPTQAPPAPSTAPVPNSAKQPPANRVGQTVSPRVADSAGSQGAIPAAMAAVQAWRSAWSRQDVPAYFKAYSDTFDVGPRFKTLKQWQHYKQRVISKRAFIRVTLEHIKAQLLPDGEIKIVFLQHFRSDAFNSDDIKELRLKAGRDGWKIVYETSK